MPRSEWLYVPNLITLGRLGLVPVFLWLGLTGHHVGALIAFGVAGASDVVDGLLARLLNQRTKLGGVLDPVADKVLMFAALGLLVFTARLPGWLLALCAFRDAWMVIGALVVRHKRLELPLAPSRVGKYATFFTIAVVSVALAGQAVALDAPFGRAGSFDAYVAVFGFLAGLCVAASTAQYFYRFGYLFFAPARSGSA